MRFMSPFGYAPVRYAFGIFATWTVLFAGCGGDDTPADMKEVDAGGDMDGGKEMQPGMDGGGNPDPVDDAGRRDANGADPAPTGTIKGRVFDAESSSVVEGATVRGPDGGTAETNAEGRFELATAAGERVVLRVEQPGYARGIEPVRVSEDATSYLEIRLASLDASGTFDAMEGGTLSGSRGASATFPAASLRTRSGDMVTGEVDVSLAALDPTNINELRAFPGDFRATREDGSEGILETYVPMDISVRQGEQELQLADGMGAEVTFPVFEPGAPATIPLWSLDPETGSWVEEGTAVRVSDENGVQVYRATIGHMSWWNCDAFINQRTCVRGCVTHEGQPVSHAYVRVRGVDFGNEGGGFTDDEGCFAEDTKAGGRLAIQAESIEGVSEERVVTASDSLMTAAEDPSACQDIGTLELSPREPASDACPSGMRMCDNSCVDLRNDAANCGGCGISCSGLGAEGGGGLFGASCVEGKCTCKNDETICDNRCTDTQVHRAHCGACGNRCETGEECVDGACQMIECADTLTLCGNACIDTNTNNFHCGACDATCGGGDVGGNLSCQGGKCVCPAGLSKCETDSYAYCADLGTDRNNCGVCGTQCSTGQECVGGSCEDIMCSAPTPDLCGNQCVDQQTDLNHCGGCDQRCYGNGDVGGLGSVLCESGSCVCESGYTDCNPDDPFSMDCRDLQTDGRNCGACGNVCVTGQTCSNGECVAISCPDGERSCGDVCVDLQTSVGHCGACGNACPGADGWQGDPAQAVQCNAGVCECPSGTTACIGDPLAINREAAALICASDTSDCIEAPAASCDDATGAWSLDLCGSARTLDVAQIDCAFASSGNYLGWFSDSGTMQLIERYQSQSCTATLSGDDLTGTCDSGNSTCALSGSRPACANTETLCGTQCTDTATDGGNCGFCGNSCGTYGLCNGGTCEQDPQADQSPPSGQE